MSSRLRVSSLREVKTTSLYQPGVRVGTMLEKVDVVSPVSSASGALSVAFVASAVLRYVSCYPLYHVKPLTSPEASRSSSIPF